MTLRAVALELMDADRADGPSDAYWLAHARMRAAINATVPARLTQADRRVRLAAIKTLHRREWWERQQKEPLAAHLAAANLDDARVELAEAIGMTHPGDFTSFGPPPAPINHPEVSTP